MTTFLSLLCTMAAVDEMSIASTDSETMRQLFSSSPIRAIMVASVSVLSVPGGSTFAYAYAAQVASTWRTTSSGWSFASAR